MDIETLKAKETRVDALQATVQNLSVELAALKQAQQGKTVASEQGPQPFQGLAASLLVGCVLSIRTRFVR